MRGGGERGVTPERNPGERISSPEIVIISRVYSKRRRHSSERSDESRD